VVRDVFSHTSLFVSLFSGGRDDPVLESSKVRFLAPFLPVT